MSTSTISKKLNITPGSRILLMNAPDGFAELLTPLPEGCMIETDPQISIPFEWMLLFSVSKENFSGVLSHLSPVAGKNASIWICYAKKNSIFNIGFSRDDIRDLYEKYGYRPVSQVALDETWTAIRIRPRSQVIEKDIGTIPGIDFEKRKVTPPEEFAEALRTRGLTEKFRALSFTHQKEHIVAIFKAKKPETKRRRIEKSIEILNKKKR